MDFRHHEQIVALAQERNFGKAAVKVHLSQPAFSRSIQAIEAQLGMTLFERGGGQIRCTPAGEFVVERSRQLLRVTRRMDEDVRMYRDKQIGDLVIGFGRFAAPALLPELLQSLGSQYPGIRVRALVNNPMLLAGMLQKEEVDFVLSDTRAVAGNPAFSIEQVARLSGGYFVRKGHPLLERDALRLADLVPYRLASSWLPDEIKMQLARAMGLAPGSDPPVALECDDSQTLKTVVLSSDVVMLSATVVVASDLAAGLVSELTLMDRRGLYSEVGLVRLVGRSLSPIAEIAAARFREIAAALPDPTKPGP